MEPGEGSGSLGRPWWVAERFPPAEEGVLETPELTTVLPRARERPGRRIELLLRGVSELLGAVWG